MTIELDGSKQAEKENLAAERGHGPEVGVAEDIFLPLSPRFLWEEEQAGG